MKVGNLGILKNLVYGASIGLCVSFILNQIFLATINDYRYVDDFSKIFHGGGATAIVLVMIAQWLHDQNEFYNLNLWVGILSIVIFWFAGSIIPIFVVGLLAILSTILGVSDFFNYLFEDLMGGFCAGGFSVGLAAGIYNHFRKNFE
jgi:hypothetical protein